MTTLQLGLIIGGIVLVVGVIIYNWMLERRVRRKIAATFSGNGAATKRPAAAAAREAAGGGRIEPTLRSDAIDVPRAAPPPVVPENAPKVAEAADDEEVEYVRPVEFAESSVEAGIDAGDRTMDAAALSTLRAPKPAAAGTTPAPDPEIECVIALNPESPVTAEALAPGLHARLGKPLRWLGRASRDGPWQALGPDAKGTFVEVAACLLLADRAGVITRPLLDRFVRMVGDLAAGLRSPFAPPDAARETARAEALDRICTDLDVQIGLTVLKPGPATIAGTKLRGVAEAAGFRLAESGRFEWVQEDTGATLYSLANYRPDPFTAEGMRLTSTPGAVFILDVPRVADPVRVFDQMKLAAKRMTQTLDATLVDDNRRPLDDAALASIRTQVQATADALKEINVTPGSQRALALFGG